MSPSAFSALVLACASAGAMLGMFVSRRLPDKYSGPDSREAIRLGMGLVATTVALVLGLLVASAKNFYDTQTNGVTQLAANVVMLDRILSYYGPDAADARTALRSSVEHWIEILELGPKAYRGQAFVDKIQQLSPKDENQRLFKAQAVNLAVQMGQTGWLMFEQRTVPVPKLLLVMLALWLTALFVSFGLFAPRNFIVQAGLFVSALAVSGAVFLILEMYRPSAIGLIRVSDAPLRAALAQLGQ